MTNAIEANAEVTNCTRYTFTEKGIYDTFEEKHVDTAEPVVLLRVADPGVYGALQQYYRYLGDEFKKPSYRIKRLKLYIKERLKTFDDV